MSKCCGYCSQSGGRRPLLVFATAADSLFVGVLAVIKLSEYLVVEVSNAGNRIAAVFLAAAKPTANPDAFLFRSLRRRRASALRVPLSASLPTASESFAGAGCRPHPRLGEKDLGRKALELGLDEVPLSVREEGHIPAECSTFHAEQDVHHCTVVRVGGVRQYHHDAQRDIMKDSMMKLEILSVQRDHLFEDQHRSPLKTTLEARLFRLMGHLCRDTQHTT